MTTTTDLIAAKAVQELAKLDLLRKVARANEAGMSQHAIADALGVAQPGVHRMLKKVRLDPGSLARSPREVVLDYAAGRLSRSQMLDELGGRDYTYGYTPEPGSPVSDAYVRGSWDEVTAAVSNRFLTDEDYREIITRVQRRRQLATA